MKEAMANVASGQITFAARDSDFDGKKIREGDFMCLSEGKLVHNSSRFEDVAKKLAKSMCSRQSGFITVFSGEGANEQTDKVMESAFKSAAPNAEITIVPGGQPVYSYIVSVE